MRSVTGPLVASLWLWGRRGPWCWCWYETRALEHHLSTSTKGLAPRRNAPRRASLRRTSTLLSSADQRAMRPGQSLCLETGDHLKLTLQRPQRSTLRSVNKVAVGGDIRSDSLAPIHQKWRPNTYRTGNCFKILTRGDHETLNQNWYQLLFISVHARSTICDYQFLFFFKGIYFFRDVSFQLNYGARESFFERSSLFAQLSSKLFKIFIPLKRSINSIFSHWA